jgi:hypothetical protein
VNDLSLDEIGTSRNAAVADLAPKAVTVWQDHVAQWIPNSDAFTGAVWIDLDSLDGISGFTGPQSGHPVNGATGVTWAPPNVNFLIHKSCAHSRSQRAGRMFITAVVEGEVDDAGNVLPAAITNWNSRIGALLDGWHTIAPIPTGQVAWRVIHVTGKTDELKPRPNSWDSTDVNSVSTDPRVATQRQRLR